MSTVASLEGDGSVRISGTANDMSGKLSKSPSYHEVDLKTAESNAKNGKLVVFAYHNNEGLHGHVGTFSVGENIGKGEIANVGSKNGFMPIQGTENGKSGVFSSNKISQVKYYTEGSGIEDKNSMPEYFHQ